MAITVSIAVENTSETQIYCSSSYSSGGTLAVRAKWYLDGVYNGDDNFTGTTSTTQYHTFSSLSSGTSYTLSVQYLDSSGNILGSAQTTGTTDSPDTTSPTVNITSPADYTYHSGSVTISADAYDADSGIDYVSFYNSTLGTITDSTSPYSATYNIGSLSDGQYTFYARAYDNAGNSSTQDSVTIYVDNTAPSVWNVQGSPKSTEIDVTWDASDGGSGLNYFRVYRSDGVSTAYNTVSSSSARSYTITGLTENTTYTIWVRGYDNVGNYADSSSKSITTLSGRPNDWKWTTSNDSYGYKIQGASYRMDDLEWNNFTSRINEFRTYKGYSTVTFTTVADNENFYATRFNEAKNAIGGMVATGISDRVKDDDVNASLFNTLMDKLNSL